MLLPVVGAYVLHARSGEVGTVSGHEGERLTVTWGDGRSARVARHDVRCGLPVGQAVQEQPRSLRPSLGEGHVLELRTLGGREQALVEFWEGAERHWLPWENLLPVWSARSMVEAGVRPPGGFAERFRLRQLALALQHWNRTTGALAQVDIDPLPHQLHLVRRILQSGNLNWLIADDVGLGKTIEVGLLLSALRQQGLRRFLLVVPAGLTRQWQAELRTRFGLGQAVIYGRDFEISDPAQWPLYEVVIGSMDRFKHERHLDLLRQSGRWDMVVFDEAHRLSRSLYGLSYQTSERYHLAAMLRGLTENVLLLSGTPHQGNLDKFEALLELLRPGPVWRERIQQLRMEPQLLSGMVIRNRKADVTDAHGEFIFKGKVTHAVAAPQNEEEQDFDRALRRYLRHGYEASRRGRQSLAIGFVMTIYRKLAASSVAAIEGALERRLRRLQNRLREEAGVSEVGMESEESSPFVEREEEVTGGSTEFFSGETEMLQGLIALARRLRQHDTKLQAFTGTLLGSILRTNPQERVLIFTEYRSTQDYLVAALERLTPGRVDVIHGGQSLEERAASIERFESEGQFLVSTEAGGEGFNLQRRCHILVNYDLPWNPMRLVQRVGRLYRYGQQKPVVVFNLNVQGSLDDEILMQMYGRLEAVAEAMAGVADEYREGLREDIVGELASFLEIEEILAEAAAHTPQRTQARIEEALERARQAAQQQNDLLRFSSGFDPNALQGELPMGEQHLMAFVEGMFAHLGVTVSQKLYGGRVWEIKLTEPLQQQLGLKQNQRVAFDRSVSRTAKALLLDGGSRLLKLLFETAGEYAFGGQIAQAPLQGDGTASAVLRWQDDRGRSLSERYVVLQRQGQGVEVNPPDFSVWLLQPALDEPGEPGMKAEAWPQFEDKLHDLLARGASDELHPAGYDVTGVAWGPVRVTGPEGEVGSGGRLVRS
ncbi:Helicase conserved C-terminal domain-containing protein [Deinococcus reticulitermitis]|uniref:Helicase conserved C-terminal domain-containing protein n=1 Tax=Deinococcus reticulitermitis TaxID=856736 RepID=A0A1H7BGI5_9DEIO|nr:helicase-related protein [Deinococcus reticulitermitis]SEJ72505.1 Helicase conserved C-terminal domain-containing protein [Deinococcus reticulitermitis]